ncbi:MAG: ATP-binding cassette, subfamily multidrug efflux pump [Actinomycetota bacterium]|nr:ATP-binding cassette, subfamily multidrug efflux pump [Actinomycetota bacterium]
MITLLRRHLRPYRRHLVVVVVLVAFQALGQLWLPSLNADIINEGVLTGDTGYILRIGGVMLAATVLLGIASIISSYFSARAAMGFGRDVRAAMFHRVQGFSLRELNHFGTPSLITRNTNDVQQVQMMIVVGLTMMLMAPITMIGGVVMALRENAQLTGLLLVIIPVMLLVIGVMMRWLIPLFRSVQSKIDKINQILRENLSGVRVIRAFVRTGYEEERFTEANADLTAVQLRIGRLFAVTMPSIMFIVNVSSVAIVWFGGRLIGDGTMKIGSLTAFISYVMQILFAVMMAVMTFVMVPRAAASGERVLEVLDTEPVIHDPASPLVVKDGGTPRGTVEFRGVEFRYPGAHAAVLRDITVTLPAGSTTAVVGGTGSGKSTLVNLIPRLYDVTSGTVLVDGVDVRDLAQQDLWSRLGLVPQRAFLFSGTVADNLRYGRESATEAEMWKALEIAQAREVVEGLPGDLEAHIDQGGTNLSGGQRQRLAIARALVRRPEIYIFDDSFSALDYATDARLRAALRENTSDATVLIIAQRISTVLGADQIVVLDEGSVVGVGTHDELLESCETYAEIVSSQLNRTEAA